jgi:hypothetical protein
MTGGQPPHRPGAVPATPTLRASANQRRQRPSMEEGMLRTREVIDLSPPPSVEVTGHQILKRYCPVCQRWQVPAPDWSGQDNTHVLGLAHAGLANKDHPCHDLCRRLLRHQGELFQFRRSSPPARFGPLRLRPEPARQQQGRHCGIPRHPWRRDPAAGGVHGPCDRRTGAMPTSSSTIPLHALRSMSGRCTRAPATRPGMASRCKAA